MTASTHTEHEHHEEHATPIVYHRTFGLLVILMASTIGASFIPLGAIGNNLVAMGIAVTKASLVVLYFMQVKYTTRLTWVWATIGFLWLLLLFGITGDYVTRWILAAKGWS